ncbi:hypothetical protein [Chryseobacterium luquanense]|uniref:Uncharacterized protein n=1 Tax=Chryseobacterium luquanense TaxID=2983766 RepID=A0ABT3Y5C1_9FLAO|nr:hypothetical protein [Chryseobacterium luquanense]MCX8533196.1 hypothetical protein [Chryseobacterium luquanense]
MNSQNNAAVNVEKLVSDGFICALNDRNVIPIFKDLKNRIVLDGSYAEIYGELLSMLEIYEKT